MSSPTYTDPFTDNSGNVFNHNTTKILEAESFNIYQGTSLEDLVIWSY